MNQHLNNTTASNNNANNWRLNANNIISVTLATTANSSNTTTTNTNSSGSNNNVSVTTQSTRQKHGAERLFAYFEADGSDPEDYNRYFDSKLTFCCCCVLFIYLKYSFTNIFLSCFIFFVFEHLFF